MRVFLIHPVRDKSDAVTQIVEAVHAAVAGTDTTIYDPSLHTNQRDAVGLRICRDNLEAIRNADQVWLIWDGLSQGSLFDLGMAFALGKSLRVISVPPAVVNTKSFQAMAWAWANGRDPDEAAKQTAGGAEHGGLC